VSRALEELLGLSGREDGPGAVELAGADPMLQTRFRIGEAAAAALGACGLLAAGLGGKARPRVRVDVRAATASLLSFFCQRLEGRETPRPALTNPTVALYPAQDGRWIHLHGGFPHLRAGTLELLGCENDAGAIAGAVARWDAEVLESALAERGLCGAMVRSLEEWVAHPQGRTVSKLPVVEVLRIGDSDPQPLWAAGRPLGALRVLDLTRVLAGPTCARTLAAFGADVLQIRSPRLPFVEPFVIDTGHGKRSAHLDLDSRSDVERLRKLACEADVFSQGYRADSLARRGFGPEALAELRPGIVYVSTVCYGHEGPWAQRPGWEQLAQCVTGIADENGTRELPQLLPAAACDYITGYLGALGTLIALRRRAREGGSYLVRVSLCQTAHWLQALDRVDAQARPPRLEELANWMTSSETSWGTLRHLRPAVSITDADVGWERPCVRPGTHEPTWLERAT
jgi:crotonobetainyl-CoA:carnitine CoA-transferase CaiB-like acyl-CoA transferase